VTLAPAGYWHPFFRTTPLDQGCTLQSSAAGDTDSTGTYLKLRCPGGPGGVDKTVQWYRPNIEDAAVSDKFFKETTGAYITRQCYKQNADSGSYEIDTSAYTVAEAAGYELISTEDTSKVVKPPRFDLPPPPPQDAFDPKN
jgi:hypothetical protein